MISGLCYICSRPANRTCRLCGKTTCERHLNPKGVCVVCASGKGIED